MAGERNVLVIGAGAAGTAAAWAARRAGATVQLVHDRAGATSLYSGALDVVHWERADGGPIDGDVVAFGAALGAWKVAAGRHRVATPAGVVRPTRGTAQGLLDLEPLAGRSIAVVELDRAEWDGTLVARALGASAWARATRTRFSAVPVDLFQNDQERRIGAYDFAALLDDPERVSFAAERLRREAKSYDAWLLGPWLGIETDASERLHAELGMPIGECTSGPGGAAGARFDLARDRLLSEIGVEVRRARATELGTSARGLLVGLAPSWSDPGTLSEESLEASAVVLALGGIAAGGIRVDPPKPAHPGGACFHVSVEAKILLELDGVPVDRVSTLHGVDFTARGLEALERVGIAADGVRARGAERLFVAGDCAAARPRTALEAARAGIAAGRAAASA